jgi:hypothetical protein
MSLVTRGNVWWMNFTFKANKFGFNRLTTRLLFGSNNTGEIDLKL